MVQRMDYATFAQVLPALMIAFAVQAGWGVRFLNSVSLTATALTIRIFTVVTTLFFLVGEFVCINRIGRSSGSGTFGHLDEQVVLGATIILTVYLAVATAVRFLVTDNHQGTR
jgi:hypothetical protein